MLFLRFFNFDGEERKIRVLMTSLFDIPDTLLTAGNNKDLRVTKPVKINSIVWDFPSLNPSQVKDLPITDLGSGLGTLPSQFFFVQKSYSRVQTVNPFMPPPR